MAIADSDVISVLSEGYNGGARIFCSPVEDLELFIFNNRDTLLSEVEPPPFKEANVPKKASKTYWKYLTVDKNIVANKLYELIVNSNEEKSQQLADQIRSFLTID